MSRRRGNGDGSIYRDGDRWVASITVASTTGRQVRRRRSARTYTEARRLLRELTEQATAGVVGSGRTTLGDYLEDWLAHVLPARKPAPGTTDNYTWAVRHHVIPALGKVRLAQLRADDVDRLLRDIIGAGKGPQYRPHRSHRAGDGPGARRAQGPGGPQRGPAVYPAAGTGA